MSEDRIDQLQARVERLEAILARVYWQSECRGNAVRPRCNDPWRDAYFAPVEKLTSSGGFSE